MITSSTHSFGWTTLLLTLTVTVTALVTPARAEKSKVQNHPGYVDPSGFADLADEDGELVEVTLGPKLLKLFSGRANRRKELGLASILGGASTWRETLIERLEARDAA